MTENLWKNSLCSAVCTSYRPYLECLATIIAALKVISHEQRNCPLHKLGIFSLPSKSVILTLTVRQTNKPTNHNLLFPHTQCTLFKCIASGLKSRLCTYPDRAVRGRAGAQIGVTVSGPTLWRAPRSQAERQSTAIPCCHWLHIWPLGSPSPPNPPLNLVYPATCHCPPPPHLPLPSLCLGAPHRLICSKSCIINSVSRTCAYPYNTVTTQSYQCGSINTLKLTSSFHFQGFK